MILQTEFEFELPKGYVDQHGTRHRQGVMRLATAADEILPLRDPRVQDNPSYVTLIVLSRVIIKLGELPDIHPKIIEGLFLEDLAYLQRLYSSINALESEPSASENGRGNGVSGGTPLLRLGA